MPKPVLILVFLFATLYAQQDKKPSDPKDSFLGVLRKISMEENGKAATLSIESGTGKIPHQIHCTADTRITKAGKTQRLAQLKRGRTIECTGAIKSDVLEAASCSVR